MAEPSPISRYVFAGLLALILAVGGVLALYLAVAEGDDSPDPSPTAAPTTATTTIAPSTAVASGAPDTSASSGSASASPRSPSTPSSSTSTTLPFRAAGTVPGFTVRQPWGSTTGLTMFRGNPTRTYYGEGSIRTQPEVLWRYPDSAMCGQSSTGGETKTWCGTGWTGQPVVWERPDGVTEVIFGAYDKAVHFVDADTGRAVRPNFEVGDIIKGSVTLDPDGFPLLYFGSRDNKLRVIALDRAEPQELWSLDAGVVDGIWNNDWDGNPAIVDDVLYEGGENGWFFAVQLNRTFGDDGKVTVDPEILVQVPGYTDDLVARVGRNQSIENSVALFDRRVYFANSGGRVLGLDVSAASTGEAPVVFDYWVGDDVDASIVVDEAGMLYVAVELERFNARSQRLGQLLKLDPYTEEDPLVWGVAVPPRGEGAGGLWATPALGDGYLYAATHPGELLVVDTTTGDVVERDELGWHAWSSPVVVGDTLLVAIDCTSGGGLRAYSLDEPSQPTPIWETAPVGGCIESTPAVWRDTIYVGSRDGYFYALGEA